MTTTADVDRLVFENQRTGGVRRWAAGASRKRLSINEDLHGIPGRRSRSEDGDMVDVDASTIYKGCFPDSSRMFCIGTVNAEKRVWSTCRECVERGLAE
ncbi:MAG: M24 family metallopeptidase [Bilophila sp.]